MTITRFDFLAAYRQAYPGVNPEGVYCAVTGKQIATLTDSEIDGLLAIVDQHDPESAADDWFTRQMASMRPSMQWNKLRLNSLNVLRKADPLGTLGYMMSRLFAPIAKPKPRYGLVDLPSLDEVIETNRNRVLLMVHLEKWNPLLVKRVLYMLAAIDAAAGLNSLTPPFSARDLYDGQGNAFAMRVKLMEWYHGVVKAIAKKASQREMQSTFYRDGSTLAKALHVSMFMDRDGPRTSIIAQLNESAAQRKARLEKQAKSSIGSIDRARKNADRGFMESMLDSLLDENHPVAKAPAPTKTEPASTPKPAAVPSTKMPKGFGIKKVAA